MRRLLDLPIETTPVGGVFSAADKRSRLPAWGEWRLVTWLHYITGEWRVLEEAGCKALEHSTVFTSCLRADSGDGSWRDFTMEFDVRQVLPSADTSMDEMFNVKGRSGVMFRYETYRRCYALFLECQERVVLYRRVEQDWIALAERELDVDPEHYYRMKIECEGDQIRCHMDGEPLFEVEDTAYPRGRVALFANTLTRFRDLSVTANDQQIAEAEEHLRREAEAAASSAENLPEAVLWSEIPLPPARRSNALDITPQGELVGAVAATGDPAYAEPGRSALVSVDLSGAVRWTRPVSQEAFQRVWDVDGDGRQEVVQYDGPVLRILDAATGEVKAEAPTPPCNRLGNRGGREDQKAYIPLYMMFPANVRGLGCGRDIAIFDLYTAFWVITDQLELLWWGNCEHGHDIGLYDIDGDGCDEVLCGFTMFDHDGKQLWTMPGVDYLIHTHDHVDHIVIGELDGDPGTGLEIALTCGNRGFYLLDQEGRIRTHHIVGHAQSLHAAKYRDDIPGLQLLAGCRWGNPGTRCLFSGSGERIWAIEPDNSYASDVPVRWSPGRDLFVVVSTPEAAGFYDGHGRRVLPFPDAELSVMDRAYCSCDLTGDGLDEVVIMTRDSVRVYTGACVDARESDPPIPKGWARFGT